MLRASIKSGHLTVALAAVFSFLTGCQDAKVHSLNPIEPPKKVEIQQAAIENDQLIADGFDRALNELKAIDESASKDNWRSVAEHHAAFRLSTRLLPRPKLTRPYVSLALVDLFDLYEVELEHSISNRNSENVSFAANQLINILSDFIAQMKPENAMEARRELRRILFLCREMELWSKRGNADLLKLRAARLKTAWKDLRPLICDHNGVQAADQFDAVAGRLDEIETVGDYNEISGDLNDAVESVSEVFTSQH